MWEYGSWQMRREVVDVTQRVLRSFVESWWVMLMSVLVLLLVNFCHPLLLLLNLSYAMG